VSPLVLASDVVVVAVGADPHMDAQHRQTGGDLVKHFLSTAETKMGADAALLLGDVVGDRAVDVDGDRDVDCSVPRVQTATCPWPSPWAAQLWRAAVAAHPIPLWALQGNHDGHQAVPLVAGGVNYSEPNGWWLQTVRPLEQPGVVGGTVDAYEVRVELAGGAWSLLVVSDVGWRQDRAQGGRVDWRDLPWRAEAYARASTMGWPGQVVTEEQIAWLEDRLVAAEVAGRHVAVATHAPPAGTVVLTDAPGRAYAQVCPPSSTFPGGIYVHGTSLTQTSCRPGATSRGRATRARWSTSGSRPRSAGSPGRPPIRCGRSSSCAGTTWTCGSRATTTYRSPISSSRGAACGGTIRRAGRCSCRTGA
jgi:hypothetical protein